MIITELIQKDDLQAYETALKKVGGVLHPEGEYISDGRIRMQYSLRDHSMMETFIFTLSVLQAKPGPVPYWQSWFKKAAQ